jgi:putative DNA primase/helicase
MPPSTTEFKVDQQSSTEIQSVSSSSPCPLCNGEYQCYTFDDRVGCAGLDEAPIGWERLKQDKNGRWIFAPTDSSSRKHSGSRKQRKGKTPKVSLPSADEVLPLLFYSCPDDDFPQWTKTGVEHGTQYEKQIEYLYPCPVTGEPLGKVVRKQWSDRRPLYGKNHDKTKEIKPWHWANPPYRDQGVEGWWSDRGKGKKRWGLYRQQAIELEIAAGGKIPVVFYVAGEEAVESARRLGLWAVTNQGGEGSFQQAVVEFVGSTIEPKLFVIWGDNDPTGKSTSEKLLKPALKAGLPTINLDPLGIWKQMPHKGDITNVVEESGMSGDEIIRALEEQIRQQLNWESSADSDDWAEYVDTDGTSDKWDTPNSLNPNEEFTQFTLNTLYGDKPWICASDKLYHWAGTHYKHSKDAVEIERLASWCNTYAVQSKGPDGDITFKYPYAKPSKVKEALEWVKMRLSIDPDLLNPPGLNCTNGVLWISWKDGHPEWELLDHDPHLYYTYEPLVKYDPDANPEACDRMLSVLDEPQQDVFLKTTGASLDLATIRQYKGRLVRALLLKGHGNNGKDTLREAVSMMYGLQGMTGCTLSDFAIYDEGRKFPLARLRHSRVNWASENANTARLDRIQSLKAFITGDTLCSEGKGKDEDEFAPTGIALFNINDTPKLQGTLEAITSRYGVLSFNKTFKIGADPSQGELEADPRFKDDPEFLKAEVLPAFLNKVLDALNRLISEGIDYSCTQKALEDIQAENSHLFQFCQDTGLGYDPNGALTAGQIWEALEQWYQGNGTLTYEEGSNGKHKAVWTDQANPYDRNVKGANQVLPRLKQLFPRAKPGTVFHPKKGQVPALKGINFVVRESPTPVPPHPTPVPPQSPPQQNTQNQGFHPNYPSFSHLDEKIENQVTDSGNVAKEDQKTSDTPQQLGWVGCDAEESSILGVGNWGASGVETEQIGVEADPWEEEAIAPTPLAPVEISFDEEAAALAGVLANEVICPNRDELSQIRRRYSPATLKAACKQLSPERYAQIRQWVIELNEAIASTQFKDTNESENLSTLVKFAPEAIQPPVEDETATDDEPAAKEEQWAWNKTTGECLGRVLSIRGNQAKTCRAGELRHTAKFYALKDITFENPHALRDATVAQPIAQALSLDVSPVANAQWEEGEQFLEELDD